MGFTNHPVFVLFVLWLMVLCSRWAARTKWGKPLGAAVLVILFTAVLANLGLVPSASNSIPLYDGIFTYLAPLGIFYLFLAVIGAYCEIGAVLGLEQVGLTLLAFTSVAVLLHGVVIIALGGLFFRDWDMVAIASQANVGGGASAIALAETFDRNELILPAIMVGTLGNALGTYLGFFVVSVL
jgi:uncharacterized membrane protein